VAGSECGVEREEEPVVERRVVPRERIDVAVTVVWGTAPN
jgi:hypothetical protein